MDECNQSNLYFLNGFGRLMPLTTTHFLEVCARVLPKIASNVSFRGKQISKMTSNVSFRGKKISKMTSNVSFRGKQIKHEHF